MKRKKKATGSKYEGKSDFWNPKKPGETCEGTYLGMSSFPNKLKKGEMKYILNVSGILVDLSASIKQALKDKFEELKIGKTKLRFIFKERKQIKKGQKPMKVIETYMNGKLLKTGGFKPLEDISEAFK